MSKLSIKILGAVGLLSVTGIGLVAVAQYLYLDTLISEHDSEMRPDELDRFLADQHQIAERGLLPEPGSAQNAGELLNPYVSLDVQGWGADDSVWWSEEETTDALRELGSAWSERPEDLPTGDLSILTKLLAYDHLEFSTSGAYQRFLEGRKPVPQLDWGMPNLFPFIGLAKIRMAQALLNDDMAPALEEVRHLAGLVYSSESLIATAVAVSILEIELTGYDAAVARGLSLPADWSPPTEADIERYKAAGWTSAYVASGLAGPEAVAALVTLAESGAAFGLCGGLQEAAWQYPLYEPFLKGQWPLEVELPSPRLAAGPLLEASGCRLPVYGQVIADPDMITIEDFTATFDDDMESFQMLVVSHTPYLRRVILGILSSIAGPSYNRYRD